MLSNNSSGNGKFDLTEKTAIVTGGAGILGRYFCEGLASSGANVAVVDIDKGLAVDAASKIDVNSPGAVVGIECDVSSKDSVDLMLKNVIEAFGKIDILVNNAACKPADLERFFAPFEDYSLDTWREVMSVNLDGMFLVAQAVGKAMKENDMPGSIIQTASVYALLGPDKRIYEGSKYQGIKINSPAVYAASKAGVIGLTKYLATYWAENGIRVNALVPGGVESGQNERFKRQYSARVPMGRMAMAEEMVGAVIYLASDSSSYMTGQSIVVDGGLAAW